MSRRAVQPAVGRATSGADRHGSCHTWGSRVFASLNVAVMPTFLPRSRHDPGCRSSGATSPAVLWLRYDRRIVRRGPWRHTQVRRWAKHNLIQSDAVLAELN